MLEAGFKILSEDSYLLDEKFIKKYPNLKLTPFNEFFNIDYSNFNIVYSYSPFNNHKQLKLMYQKIISEIKPGSIIIEHANKGLGHFNLLEEFNDLEKINLDYLYIFRKL